MRSEKEEREKNSENIIKFLNIGKADYDNMKQGV
jgi:hypothetical protein